MARKLYDLAVKTGTYQKDGETKNRYMNIGAIFQGDKGNYMVMSAAFNPAGIERKEGSDSIFVSLFEPREEGQGQRQQRPAQRQNDGFEDNLGDVPF